MNPPTCDELDDIHVLVAAQNAFSTTAAARCYSCADTNGSAHDASTCLLYRCHADGNAVWEEVPHGVAVTRGCLMIDDTTPATPYRRAIALVTRHWSGNQPISPCGGVRPPQIVLVTRHWSGNQQRVVVGITLIRLVWTDGDAHLPGDVRIYDQAHDGVTKHDPVRAMMKAAAARGCQPHWPGFASRYAGLEHVQPVRALNRQWLTRLQAKRLGDPDGLGNRPIRAVPIPRYGAIVHCNGYGFITVFTMAPPDGGIASWATGDLEMSVTQGAEDARCLWRIEASHRGITQVCGIERARHRSAVARRNPMGLALRAFLRLNVTVCGTLRHFQAFFWLRVFPAPKQNPRPPTRR